MDQMVRTLRAPYTFASAETGPLPPTSHVCTAIMTLCSTNSDTRDCAPGREAGKRAARSAARHPRRLHYQHHRWAASCASRLPTGRPPRNVCGRGNHLALRCAILTARRAAGGKYTYRVCPFEKVEQKEGSRFTRSHQMLHAVVSSRVPSLYVLLPPCADGTTWESGLTRMETTQTG
jgi:hypothetical protein